MGYKPIRGVFVGKPPCQTCGGSYRSHRFGACPESSRPANVEDAERLLQNAESSGDPARVFVARGEVQRLRR